MVKPGVPARVQGTRRRGRARPRRVDPRARDLGLETSRFARSSADWHQLLDLCALTGTLIADSDGVYSPADVNDRLLLGLKGTMSEAELHLIRARLDGGL